MGKLINFNEEVNVESPEAFEQDFGDAFPIADFIEMCESNELIDYDGSAEEILLEKKVIWANDISPSEVLSHKQQLLELNARFDNKLEIVWYNR